ncbi:MAG: hypothetical protein WCQ54_07625 [Clostridiaceae bacterium]
MAKLLYQGHGSFRITTDENIVIGANNSIPIHMAPGMLLMQGKL